jgi:LmbE family N-acetylglucosaminyl deacetylase
VEPAIVQTDPAELFPGRIMLVAPHMDDEVLACGGTIARLPNKERIHVVYATDGLRSPSPILPQDEISSDLGEIRVQESVEALAILGIPGENLCFLRLPEAELKRNVPALRQALRGQVDHIKPDHILIPFRYDRHPDHLAINHVVTEMRSDGQTQADLTEYFVYHRWRLLPERDIRKYVRPQYLQEVDTTEVAVQKRTALDCFRSQTTIFYSWQTRPILTPHLLDEESTTPEYFLRYDPSVPGAAVFARAVLWIRLAHRLEPFLQRWKYRIGASLRRMLRMK